MIKKLFFCEQCRKQLEDVSLIHFVEDHSDRGFCSETCILDFYRPYMQALEDEEHQFRQELNMNDNEGHSEILGSDHYLQLALNSPSETWRVENDLNQKFYTHILQIQIDSKDFFIILICSHIDGAPSFVFYRTLTSSMDLLKKYQRDHLLVINEQEDEFLSQEEDETDLGQEIIEQIEFKKSFLLADMLEKRMPNDIGFEKFPEYDQYLELTLKSPDEIYEFEDDEGDILHTCIKSYQLGEKSFFYILIAMPYGGGNDGEGIVMVPILGFPSNDKTLYPKYAIGKRIDPTLAN